MDTVRVDINCLFVVHASNGIDGLLELLIQKPATMQGRIEKQICNDDAVDNVFKSSVVENLQKYDIPVN